MRNENTTCLSEERPQPRRKIEQQMLAAIRDGKNWQGGNTTVEYHPNEYNAGVCSIFLHGNRIALYDRVYGVVIPVHITFKDWPTRTTVSRLRALGLDASVKGGRPHLNGEPI